MKQGLRWVLLCLAGLLVAAIATWIASRLWGTSPEQRRALVLLRSEWMPGGRNAFAAMWTLQYDVPADRQREVTDMDARVVRGWSPFQVPSREFRSAAASYPDLKPAEADRERFCTASKPGCLAMVSADIPGYAALVERNARLIARVDALGEYDHVKLLLPPRVDTPLPAFANTYLPATRDALLFAQGRQEEALGNVCRGIAGWRRHAANTDMLIVAMVATSYAADGYGGLFADMLAAMPRDATIPAECGVALAPVQPAELSLCEAMKGEFAFGDNAMRSLAASPSGQEFRDSPLARRILFDAEGTSAMHAANMAAICEQGFQGRIAQDSPIHAYGGERRWRGWFACAGNPTGCILSDIAKPAYVNYVQRRQDFGMKLKLMGTLLWLHENPKPGTALADRVRQRPMHLHSPARGIEVSGDGTRLAIRLHEASKGEWSLPLAP